MTEAIVPKIYNPAALDEKITIQDEEAFETSRLLASKEGLFVGYVQRGSGGRGFENSQEYETADHCHALARPGRPLFKHFSIPLDLRSLSAVVRLFFQRAPLKCLSRTGCNADRFLSLFQTVQAHIALLHGAVFIKLRYANGTGIETGTATVDIYSIHYHDSIFIRWLIAPCRAGCRTGSICTMPAGKRIESPRNIRESACCNFHYFSELYSPSFYPMPLLTGISHRPSI